MLSMLGRKSRNLAPLEAIGRQRKDLMPLTGFTLQELIVVIVIISILAVLALPQFGITRERSLVREALTNLRLIAAAEKIYRLEIGVYYIPGQTITAEGDINTNLKLSLSENNWDYSIAVPAGGNSFTANADRTGGTYLDCIYRIDQVTDDPCTCDSSQCPPNARVCISGC